MEGSKGLLKYFICPTLRVPFSTLEILKEINKKIKHWYRHLGKYLPVPFFVLNNDRLQCIEEEYRSLEHRR